MISVLVAGFDPVSMGLGMEVETLSQHLLKHKSVTPQLYVNPKFGSSMVVSIRTYQYPVFHSVPTDLVPEFLLKTNFEFFTFKVFWHFHKSPQSKCRMGVPDNQN